MGIEQRLADIQADVDRKHRQNRDSIHELRSDMQGIVDRQFAIQQSFAPYVRNGNTKGKLDIIAENVESIMAAQERRQGAKELAKAFWFWVRWLIMAILAALGMWHEAKK